MSTGLYSGTSGLALGVGLYKGYPGLWGGAAGLNAGLQTALYLDFLADGQLDPRITFSRGSNATLIDATGKLTYAPNNLVINSEAFDNASWVKFGTTSVVANADTAPNGTLTADAITLPSASGIYRIVASTVGTGYVMSMWLRSDTPQTVRLLSNTDTGVIVSTTCSVTTSWQRFYVYRVAPAGSTTVNIQLDTGGGGTFYAWGAQIEAVTYQTTPSTYNSTSPANFLGFTQEFDNAAWVKFNATVTADATTSPDGTLTADKLVENTAVTAQHRVSQVVATISGSTYTYSVYVKAAERTSVQLRVIGATTFAAATFNLLTGTFSGNIGAGSTIASVGDGWYRISVSGTADNTAPVCYVNLVDAGSISYTGDGTSGVFLWGAQLSNSGSVDPYVYNPSTALTSTAYYGPRFDYDPQTLASKGLLIEEQRTNLLTYSEQFDNAAWTKTSSTVEANATTAPDGTLTADSGVTGGSAFQTNQGVTITSGATVSGFVYLKPNGIDVVEIVLLSSGNVTPYGRASFNVATGVISTAATTANGGTNVSAAIAPAGNGWYRCSVTVTYPAVTAAGMRINASGATGGIFLWGAQLEAGAFATSYIPTVASQVTRSADIARMLGANFTNWFNASEGAFAASYETSPNIFATYLAASNGVVAQNSIHFDNNSGGTMRVAYYSGSAAQAVLSLGAYGTAGAINTVATAYAVNDFAASRNGGAVVTDTSGALPLSLTQLNIGADPSGAAVNVTNTHIRQIAYYNTRLPNATLQSLTAQPLVMSLSLDFINGVYDA